MEVWMAAAEIGPLAQTGGLADVLRALPPALARRGHVVRRFLPAYGNIEVAGFRDEGLNIAVPLGPARLPARFLSRAEADGAVTTLVINDELFGRDGIYGPPGGSFGDNARRYAFLSRAVCEYALRRDTLPDLLHLHDWHVAMVPLLVRNDPRPAVRPRTILTIHNLGYQGRFGAEELDWLGLPPALRDEVMRPEAIEDEGGINFLKAGLVFADRLTTVSPTYAREIVTPEGGFGLDPFLRRRGADLTGILNGADYDLWNPESDGCLPQPYGPDTLEGKAAAALRLRETLGLPPAERPILGVVSRFVAQKGIDLVAEAAPALLAAGADLALLGAGDGGIEERLEGLRREQPRRIGLKKGFDTSLAHLVVAGSDLLLVPSRYEPCGLTQMHALRYGTIPVVRRTGGLADTVRDESAGPGRGTGFSFDAISAGALAEAVGRALRLRAANPAGWRDLQRRAMAEDFSWDAAAARYEELYAAIPPGTGALR